MRYLQAGFPPYFTKNFFQSHWQVTQKCNFHCAYCVNEEQRRDGIHMSPEIMRAALGMIAGLSRPSYRFSLSGGEVTLYPHLEDMLSSIATLFPAGTVVTMLSNGSASPRRMRALLSLAPTLQCRFIITIHPGQTRVSDLIEKLLSFSPEERKNWFHLKLVAPPQESHIKKIRTQLDAAGIFHYSVHAVMDFATGKLAEGYKKESLSLLAPSNGRKEYFSYRHVTEHGEKDVTFLEGLWHDMFHYTGMFCSAGYQSIYLDEYGHVSKGQFCGRMPYTILEKNPFTDPQFITPMRCTEPHCTCTPYTSLPKWRNDSYAPAWSGMEHNG
ncbi:MAG: radical SAM protein [Desulfovibrionaceae bacterium]|nr:radical SAM protein [Desulfovibrionaceae bacterium]